MRKRSLVIGLGALGALLLPMTQASADPVAAAGAGVYREFGMYREFPAGSLYVDWYSDGSVDVDTSTRVEPGTGHYFAEVVSCPFGPCQEWSVAGDADVVIDPVTQTVTLNVTDFACPMHIVWSTPSNPTPAAFERAVMFGSFVYADAEVGGAVDWKTDGYACGRTADSDNAWSFAAPYVYAA